MTEFEKYRPVSTRLVRAVPSGESEMVRGKLKPKLTIEEFYKTQEAGEMSLKKWAQTVLKIVKADEKLNCIYEAIRKYMDTHVYFLHKEQAKIEWALDCLYIEAYKYWPEFVYPEEEQTIIWL